MNAPKGLTFPVARASVPSNMSKAPPTKTTMPPTTQSWAPRSAAPRIEIPKPMRVSPFGVRPALPMPSAMGSKTFLMRPRDSFEMVTGLPLARETEDGALARGELFECFLPQAADRLAAVAARLDHARGAEPAEMPGHERLAQADVGDQLGDGRLALGEAPDDAQAVHVGHDLVEGAQLAQVLGLGDGGCDGATDSGGGGGQGAAPGWGGVVVASTTIYINRR